MVVGATGHFGQRICRRLRPEPNVRLVVASRAAASAERLAAALRREGAAAAVVPAVLDQQAAGFRRRLADLDPFVVLHTAGPYQGAQGEVASACAAIGSHYLDLADGREFVAAIARHHESALRAGVLLVSGASTLPGVSSAVLDECRRRFAAIESVATCIAPAHRTPRGLGTVAAVLSYCGQPFDVLENGQRVRRYGWQDLRVQRFPALGRRLSAACDVPDLDLLPRYAGGLRTATFHAALAAPWEHLALWLMASLRRAGWVRDWRRFAAQFKGASRWLAKLGSDVGGMSVIVRGRAADGRSLCVDFQLTARRNHGPEIPCSPLLVLARRLLRDDCTLRGAQPCLGLVSLKDLRAELRGFDVDWTITDRYEP